MEKRQRVVMEPVKKKTRLYEDVVGQITGKIRSGALKPGDRLPTERELAAQLGVSRSSVREALRALELMGMIESKVKEGTFIRRLDLDAALLRVPWPRLLDGGAIMEMYEVRAHLEGLSIRLAARNRTEEHLERLRGAVESLREEIAAGKRGVQGDGQFHQAVAEAAGNGVLRWILGMCADMVGSSITLSNTHANVNVLVDEHREMYEAIARRDEKLAERLMREHIGRARDRTRFIAERVGNDGGPEPAKRKAATLVKTAKRAGRKD